MMSNEKRYSIGKIAELCNVTTWQMRYYDKHGILSPDFKDDDTKYRYYSQSKMEELLLLAELRRIGFPLREIANLISQRDLPVLKEQLAKSVDRAKAEANAAQKKYEQTVDLYIRISKAMEFLQVPSLAMWDQTIQIVEVPVSLIVYTRYNDCLSAQLGLLYRRAELYKIIDQYNLAVAGANMAILHNNYLKQFNDNPDDSEGDLEMCVSVEPNERCQSLRTFGGFKAVSAIHIGDYLLMKSTYLQLENWAAQQNLALSGAAVEEYLVGPTMTTNKDSYITRIYLPLKGSKI